MSLFRAALLLSAVCGGAALLEGLNDFDFHPTDYQSDMASADFDVCKNMVNEMHKSLGKDRTHGAVMTAFHQVRSSFPAHQQPLCDSFMKENSADVISLLQVEQIDAGALFAANPELGAAAAETGGGGMSPAKPPAYNAFGEVDKGKMETFWNDKGQYCSSCLGIMGRLTRYMQRNNTQDAIMERILRLCRFLPADLQPTCKDAIGMWGTFMLSSFISRNRLPYLCLKAGLCEATVIVSPKKSAFTNDIAFASYKGEPVVVPPKAYTKPIISFPSDKTKPPTLKFTQKDQYDREPEVLLKKENFYDPKLIAGETVRKMKKEKNPFKEDPLPPKPGKFDHVSIVKEVSFLEVESKQDNATFSDEPTIEGPPPMAKKEDSWWKVPNTKVVDKKGTKAYPPHNEDLKEAEEKTPEDGTMYKLEAPDPEDDEGVKMKITPPNFFDPQVMINTKADYRAMYQAKRGFEEPFEGIPATPIGVQDCMGALGQPKVGGRGPCLRVGGMQIGGMGPIIPGEIGVAEETASPKFQGMHPLWHKGCSVCSFMIKSMDEFMRSSRTLRSISPLIARLCDKCNSEAESVRCKAMIQKHGYKMYQIFVTKLQAESVCPAIGVCDEHYFNPEISILPETFKKRKEQSK